MFSHVGFDTRFGLPFIAETYSSICKLHKQGAQPVVRGSAL